MNEKMSHEFNSEEINKMSFSYQELPKHGEITLTYMTGSSAVQQEGIGDAIEMQNSIV